MVEISRGEFLPPKLFPSGCLRHLQVIMTLGTKEWTREMTCGGWLRHLEPGFGIIFTGDMLVSVGCLNNIMAIRKTEYSHHVGIYFYCQINLLLYPSVETALQEQSTILIWAVLSNPTEQSLFLILAMILNLVVILISTYMLLFSNYSFFITLFFLFC